MPLAALCDHFGSSPSERLGILDPVIALDLDQAAMIRLHRFERSMEARHIEALRSGNEWFSAGGSRDPGSRDLAGDFARLGGNVEYV